MQNSLVLMNDIKQTKLEIESLEKRIELLNTRVKFTEELFKESQASERGETNDVDEEPEDVKPAKKAKKAKVVEELEDPSEDEAEEPEESEEPDDADDLDEALGKGPGKKTSITDEDIRSAIAKVLKTKGDDGKKKVLVIMKKYTKGNTAQVKDILKGKHSELYAALKKV